ncbi:MAG: hypothetical protein NTY60_01970 [Proteobacteria bacterium]|nr:hypothetical protein [Pseudomonadota bacterium]
MKASDAVAKFLIAHQVQTCFELVGGDEAIQINKRPLLFSGLPRPSVSQRRVREVLRLMSVFCR